MASATTAPRTQRRPLAPLPVLVPPRRLPGVRPAMQRRSQALVERLLEAALALLEDRDFDGLTIDDLCHAAGATVGSFYARFDTKDAFITALQHLVYERTARSLERALADGRVPLDDLEGFAAWVCDGTVTWFQRYRGFIRASSRLSGSEPKAWEPLRALGVLKTQWCLPLFRQLAGARAGKSFEASVRAGLQVLHGTLNNITVVDPGPLRLDDPATKRFLTTVVLGCVRQGLAPSPPTGRAAGRRRRR
ncbi:MAG: TetR/AcrR family transcriptional regulator [Hyphomicrobiaceae bacterium]|nr:TetR/AcrR family transcriptional regulator [Hyphomicrobiaceae bacterium]